jgi:hypothetical protein
MRNNLNADNMILECGMKMQRAKSIVQRVQLYAHALCGIILMMKRK